MFADPIANFTYNGVAQTLPRISTSGSRSVYRAADGSLIVTVSHQTTRDGKIRSMYRVDRNVDVNSDNVLETESAHIVLERPASGFSETDSVNLVVALTSSLTASTNAGIKKIHGMET